MDITISDIITQTNIPVGHDHGCLPLPALWDQLDPDGRGFSTSTRNVRALQAFCAHIALVGYHVNDDIVSLRALQDVVNVFRQLQAVGMLIDLQPSLPERLYEYIDSTLKLRSAGKEGNTLGLPAAF